MRLRSTAVFAIALLATAAVAGTAAAQGETQSRDDSYFALKLMLAVAGTVDAGNGNVSASDGAKPTFGAGAAYMVPLHRYFVLGGQLALQSWRTSGGGSRNVLGDLTAVPQGRLPLSRDLELYVSLPLGISLDFLNQVGANVPGAVSVDADPAIGFTFSLMGGARFALSDSFGLLVEAGYVLHSFSHSINVQTPLVGVNAGNVDIDIEQLALNFGVWF